MIRVMIAVLWFSFFAGMGIIHSPNADGAYEWWLGAMSTIAPMGLMVLSKEAYGKKNRKD